MGLVFGVVDVEDGGGGYGCRDIPDFFFASTLTIEIP